jgi:hypothetical protein
MVQGIIGRLAGYSAGVKTFNLTIIAALIAVAFDKSAWNLLLLGVVVTVVFAMLDAYYLATEKCFRECYDAIASRPWPQSLDLRISHRPSGAGDVLKSVGSVSVWGFYAPLLGGLLILAYLLSYVQPDAKTKQHDARPVGTTVAGERAIIPPQQHLARPASSKSDSAAVQRAASAPIGTERATSAASSK